MNVAATILANVKHEEPGYAGTPCWIWQRSKRAKGYGQQWDGRRNRPAHVLSYEFIGGLSIPAGLVLDHLCRKPACCNPAHLEAVTHQENILRGVGIAAQHAVKTHCPKGHEYTPENTAIRASNGARRCRTCRNLERARQRRKA